jgi:3-oxoacyl-[acyl-carrier protein] reductase
MIDLGGRVCVVTGSTRGIGWAAARKLAAAGAQVVLNGRAAGEALEARRAELEAATGRDVLAVAADAGDPRQVKALYAKVFEKFRRLDVLVNNAGIMKDARLGMITDELASGVWSVNLTGALLHLQEASRLMSRANSGSIVNMSSIIGRVGFAGQTVYAASKAAVIGMTYAAAKELAPKNIRVNAIAPGFIETDLTRGLDAAKRDAAIKSIAIGRPGSDDDVASVILFFASDLSAYVTGQVLGVDGGMLA